MKKCILLILLILFLSLLSLFFLNRYSSIDYSPKDFIEEIPVYAIGTGENDEIFDWEKEYEFNEYFDEILYNMEDDYYRIRMERLETPMIIEERAESIEGGYSPIREPILLPMTEPQDYGTLVYKIDTLFTIGVTSRVEARIIKLVSEQTTENLISLTHQSSTGRIESVIIKVGDVMDMELVSIHSDAFEITKIGNGNQPIDSRYVAYWVWGVTPLKVGEFDLILRAIIREGNINRHLVVFDDIITVQNKPKKKYYYEFNIPDNIKRYEKNIFRLDIYEDGVDYNFEWGGDGKIILEFDKNINFEPNNNYYIEYNKSIFNYRWVVEPLNSGELNYTLKIRGDYEEIILETGTIKVKKNFNESFNRFVDGMLKRWYFIFTALIIPLYMYIKKKYFKKEEDKK